jgi:hypothetical protein
MVQIAWRFLVFQKDSALSQWFHFRTENTTNVLHRTQKPIRPAIAE